MASAAAQSRGPDPAEDSEAAAPFIAANGRLLRVSCRLEPVMELKGLSRIGFRMVRTVVDQLAGAPLPAEQVQRLSRADLERIDLAVIARGIDRMRAEAGAKEPTLIVPVSYINLSHPRSRAHLVAHFRQARELVQRGLICEVTDIEGAPEWALPAAVSMIRPYCMLVIGRRTLPARDHAVLAAAGLQGASVECPPDLENDGAFVSWTRRAIEAGRRVARSVMALGLPSTRHMAIAAHLGATHASLTSTLPGRS